MSERQPAPSGESAYPGRVAISPQAIAAVAQTAVSAAYGVVGLAPARWRPRLLRRLERSEPLPGIVVTVDRQQRITITLHVIVEYGVRLSEVARNVMDTVGFAVEQALGMPVLAVNVHIDGLHFSREP